MKTSPNEPTNERSERKNGSFIGFPIRQNNEAKFIFKLCTMLNVAIGLDVSDVGWIGDSKLCCSMRLGWTGPSTGSNVRGYYVRIIQILW